MNLSDEQKTKVNEATEKTQTLMRDLGAKIREASPEERQAKMEDASKQVQAKADEAKKTIEGVLQPKQLERLKGISLQLAGPSAFMDKEVQQELKLSDDQITKIKTATEEMMKKGNAMVREGGDPQTMGPKMEQLRVDFDKQVADVLTAEQKTSMEKMKGEKFEMPTMEWRKR